MVKRPLDSLIFARRVFPPMYLIGGDPDKSPAFCQAASSTGAKWIYRRIPPVTPRGSALFVVNTVNEWDVRQGSSYWIRVGSTIIRVRMQRGPLECYLPDPPILEEQSYDELALFEL